MILLLKLFMRNKCGHEFGGWVPSEMGMGRSPYCAKCGCRMWVGKGE